jgi:aspartyl-tRNA(Asn)/glutamyl-tRNA(Gln) amidotransferase subunit A
LFDYESIHHYHSLLTGGRTTCEQAVVHYLQQINSKQHLNAFLHVYAEEAISKAKSLDKARIENGITGKLHGVIVALKDVISYKDHPVTAASNILKGFTSVYNASVVEKLLDEEAIIIGHTNCDEFAMGSTNENSAYGTVLNALDEGRVPGGSSGGSAVAVQAGMCMVSLGTDTGGSVRQPADFCGIVGFKPTYGVISRFGVVAYASSFDQIGIFAHNVEDIAVVLETISGGDEYDSTLRNVPPDQYPIYSGKLSKPRIGYLKEAIDNPALDPEISFTLKKFIVDRKAEGYDVKPVHFDLLDHIVPAYYILTTAEASSNLSRYDGVRFGYRATEGVEDLTDMYSYSRSSGFGKEVKRRIMLGTFVLSAGYYDAYFTKAQQVRRILIDQTRLIFNEFDVLLLPTSPSTAFRLGEKMKDPVAMYAADIFTVFANLTGLPAISLPLFWHSNGLPFSLQIMTYRFCELSLLQLSSEWMARYRTSRILKNPNI